MTVALVVVAWNGERWLEACLRSVLAQSQPPAALIIVDNASTDRSLDAVMRLEAQAVHVGTEITVLPQRINLGFTAGANVGLRHSLAHETQPDVIALVNQDATIDPDWCAQVNAALDSDPRAGVVGSRILHPNRQTLQHAGGCLERPSFTGRHMGHHAPAMTDKFATPRRVEFVTAAAFALRARALRDVGLFNEVFSPGYYEDVDLCTRLDRAGWTTWYWPDAVATHEESGSFSDAIERMRLSHRNRLLYALPWIVEPAFRAEFLSAERQKIDTSSAAERRGLSLAYLSALLRLPLAARIREPGTPTTGQQVAIIAKEIADLRRVALDRLSGQSATLGFPIDLSRSAAVDRTPEGGRTEPAEAVVGVREAAAEGGHAEALTIERLPIPPFEMRQLVGPADEAAFENPSRAPIFGVAPERFDSVLDFGCGCGRLARQMLQQVPRPRLYTGFDLHAGMIRWCNANLAPLAPGFTFLHHDVSNRGFNPGSPKLPLRPMPAEDGSVSLLIAHSVFTHVIQPHAEYYLREAARVLRPDGEIVATAFLFEKRFFPMMQEFQNALYINADDPTNATIFDRDWLQATLHDIGLGVVRVQPPWVRGFHWTLHIRRLSAGEPTVALPEDRAPFGRVPPPVIAGDASRIGH